MEYEKIGNFIAECRKEKAMTQKELAIKIGVTDKAVSKWERGLGCPDVSLLGELSNELGIGIGELLNGERSEALKDNNKFILEAVNYTQKSVKSNLYNKITNLIIIFIILFGIYLLSFNFNKTRYLTDYMIYDFSNSEILELKSSIKVLKEKLEIVKNIKREDVSQLDNFDYNYIFNYFPYYFIQNLDEISILRFNNIERLKKVYILDEIRNNDNLNILLSTQKILYDNKLIKNDEIYYDIIRILLVQNNDSYIDEFGNRINFGIYNNMPSLEKENIDQYIKQLSFIVKYYDKIIDELLKEMNINE